MRCGTRSTSPRGRRRGPWCSSRRCAALRARSASRGPPRGPGDRDRLPNRSRRASPVRCPRWPRSRGAGAAGAGRALFTLFAGWSFGVDLADLVDFADLRGDLLDLQALELADLAADQRVLLTVAQAAQREDGVDDRRGDGPPPAAVLEPLEDPGLGARQGAPAGRRPPK